MIEGGPSGGCIIYDDYGHGKNERESNARLIAAAPELYEALQSCVTQMRVWVAINGDLIGALQQNIDAAESALAKARGEDRSHEGK